MAGFVALHRSIFDHPVWQMTTDQRIAFITMLSLANWRESRALVGGKEVIIPRGALIYSQAQIADKARVSRKVVRRAMKILEELGTITRREVGRRLGHGVWMTTFANYDEYQTPAAEVGPGLGPNRAPAGPEQGPSGAPSEPLEQGNQGNQDLISKTQGQDPLWSVLQLHRALVLSHPGATVVGWKRDDSFRKHANKALECYRAILIDPGLDPETQRAVLRFAFGDQSTWGNGVCWADILSGASPAAAFLKHAKRLHGNYQKASGRTPKRTDEEIFGAALVK